MNAQEPQAGLPWVHWIWRVLYVVSPAVGGVSLLAAGRHAPEVGRISAFALLLLLGWILFLTVRLVFKWRAFLFLIWASPLSLWLLSWTADKAVEAQLVSGGMCSGVPTVVVLCAAALLPGFVVGLLGSVVRLYLRVRSRVVRLCLSARSRDMQSEG